MDKYCRPDERVQMAFAKTLEANRGNREAVDELSEAN